VLNNNTEAIDTVESLDGVLLVVRTAIDPIHNRNRSLSRENAIQ
jgi:hypothetical protein